MANMNVLNDDDCILDPDSSRHVTSRYYFLSNYQGVPNMRPQECLAGDSLQPTGRGTMQILCENKDGTIGFLSLPNVEVCEGAPCTLLSISQLVEEGASVQMNADEFRLFNIRIGDQRLNTHKFFDFHVLCIPMMEFLNQTIMRLFPPSNQTNEERLQLASTKYLAMEATVEEGLAGFKTNASEFKATAVGQGHRRKHADLHALFETTSGWKLSWTVVQVILMLAVPKIRAPKAMVFAYDLIHNVKQWKRSVNLRKEVGRKFDVARARRHTAVLGFGLTNNDPLSAIDFEHWFVLVIGPEGFRLYQAHEGIYSLLGWMESDGARIRDQEEMHEFLTAFDELQGPRARWNETLSNAYRACFGIDIPFIHDNGAATTANIAYDPRISYYEISWLEVENIQKFQWELDV